MALKEFITRSPKWVSTINATEGGSIFGPKIPDMMAPNNGDIQMMVIKVAMLIIPLAH